MIEVKPHWFDHWCSFWPDGLAGEHRFLWTHLCRMHDIMGALSELGPDSAVICGDEIFTWERLGFDCPPAQRWQDMWLKLSMFDLARYHPGLTKDEREQVVKNAKIMYLGLRTLGVFYRSIL